jgi:outer membrane receptor protein involved in Fe transport
MHACAEVPGREGQVSVMTRPSRIFLTALLTIAGLAGIARAQAVYGTVVGTVTDPSGAQVAGATVTILDMDRNVSTVTTTNDSGNFRQGFLIVGRYQVKVERPGFRTYVRNNVSVSVDNETTVDIKLELGNTNQTVEVTAQGEVLKTERSDVAITFSQKQVQDLPSIGRRFSNFELITPGVTQTSGNAISTESENPMGSYRVSVNGQMYSAIAQLLDGTDNHDAVLAYQVINPPLDAVTEAKITTNAFDAEFGMAGAMVVSSQTKSGTNQLHGSLFEYLRNDHLEARNPFTQSVPVNGRAIPVTIWNQYGGSAGGAIKKNKLFYFGDYQGTNRRTGGSVTEWVPSAANRAGNLSDLGLNIFDPNSATTPSTRTQYPGNKIPTNQLSPQGAALLSLIPLPNLTAGPNQPNYVGSGSVALLENSFDTRADYFATDKLRIFGRYSMQRFNMTSPALFGLAGGTGFDSSQFAGTSYSLNHSVAVGADYTLSPTLLTDFRFGWFRYYVNVNPLGLDSTPAQTAGIPGLNTGAPSTGGMPQISGLPNGFGFGFGLGTNNCNCPLLENQHQFQYVNDWTKISGNHTIKFGTDIRHAYNLRVPSDAHRAGQLTFANTTTSGPNGGGNAIASFLLGDVSSFSRYVSTIFDAAELQNRFFFFGQDTWQVTPRLTVNYGLRWENYAPQYVNAAGNGGRVDQSTGEVLVAGSQGVSLNMNTHNKNLTFAPRLGIAYKVTDKTVIRVGYGRGFDLGIFGAVFGHNVTQNLPVLAAQQVNPAVSYQTVFTLAQGPPAAPNPASLLAAQPKGPTGNPLEPNGYGADITAQNVRIPTVDSWNFTIQQQITPTSSIEVAYIGNKGTHVQPGYNYGYNTNDVSLAGYNQGLSTNQRKPLFNQFGWTQSTRYSGNDSSSHYEAFQAKIEKRMSGGLQLLGHYTFSKALDFDSNQYIYNRSIGYGPSSQNRNQAIVVSGLYQLPIGRDQKFFRNISRPLDYVVGGWQINLINSWMTGLPFTPGYTNCGSDEDVSGECRANVLGSWQVANPGQTGWYSACASVLASNGQACGAWQRPQKGAIGNVGRNVLYGPHFWETDFSVFKEFAVRERLRLQFRAEAYNFLNHVNLGQPNATVDAPNTAGKIFAAAGTYVPEIWQLGLRLSF